jgi:hypothetical protein
MRPTEPTESAVEASSVQDAAPGAVEGIALASAPLGGFGPAFGPSPAHARAVTMAARPSAFAGTTTPRPASDPSHAALREQLMAALARQLSGIEGPPAGAEGRCRLAEPPFFECDDVAVEGRLAPAAAGLHAVLRQIAALDAAATPALAYNEGRFALQLR